MSIDHHRLFGPNNLDFDSLGALAVERVVAASVGVLVLKQHHGIVAVADAVGESVDLLAGFSVEGDVVEASGVTVERLFGFVGRDEHDVGRAGNPRPAAVPVVLSFVAEFVEQPLPEVQSGVEVRGVQFEVVNLAGVLGVGVDVTHGRSGRCGRKTVRSLPPAPLDAS